MGDKYQYIQCTSASRINDVSIVSVPKNEVEIKEELHIHISHSGETIPMQSLRLCQ